MERNNLKERPSPIKCPKKYCYFWNEGMDKRREKHKKYKIYSTASRFSGMKDNEFWSIYAHYIDDIDDEWSRFELCFLFDNAPDVLLKAGNKFELFEDVIVGIGEVL